MEHNRITVLLFVTAFVLASIGRGAHAGINVCPGAVPESESEYDGHDFSKEASNWSHFNRGLGMVEEQNWNQAMREFNYYISHPRLHRGFWGVAYYGLGVMNQKKGDVDAAIACYQRAIQQDLHPEASVADKAYQNIGAIYLKKKDYVKAIENYKKAVEKDPKSGLSHYYLGMSYLKSGDLENAEKEKLEARKLGVTYTALAEWIAEARNPSATKPSDDGEPSAKAKQKKRKAAK